VTRLRLPLCASLVSVLWLAGPASGLMAQVIHLDPPISRTEPSEQPLEAVPQPGTSVLPSARGRTDGAQTRLLQAVNVRSELVPLRPERLRSHGGSVSRLSGDTASERFILFLPQAPEAAELQIAHRSGIDALPERSALLVSVNGTELGQIVPSNFSGFATDALAVPDGLLRPGRNLVEVRARHTHRIACGADASFALWTEIDAGNSGVAMPADAFDIGPLGFMAAIAAQSARGAPVTFRRPDPSASMLAAAPFVARAASALGGMPPEINSAPYWTLDDDVPQLARITTFPPGEGPSIPQFRRGGDGALVLVVEPDQDFSAMMDQLLSSGVAPTDVAPVTLTPGLTQPLSALGVERLQGQGRYVLLSVDFALPWDWVLLASQKAQFDLDYRFASGLPAGALLLVKVNGITVRLLPLDRDGGQNLPTLPISFGTRLLQPGVNRLDFEALIPGDPPDVACPPMAGPVLEISAQSQLYVPVSPRMSQPSIDMSLAMITADSIAMTPAAEARLSPGLLPQIAAVLMVAHGPDRPNGLAPRFNIGVLSDLEQLQTPMLRHAARTLYEVLGTSALQTGREQVTGTPWETVSTSRGVFGWLRLSTVAEIPGKIVDTIAGFAFGTTPPLIDWLAGREAQAAILQPDPNRPEEIWLIFSPYADPLTVVQALAASRTGHDRPRGQVALYTDDGRGWSSWTAPDRRFTLHENLGPGNLRAVMGNYATRSPAPFVAFVFALTLLSAALALAILILTRRRGQ